MRKIRKLLMSIFGVATMLFSITAFSGCDKIESVLSRLSELPIFSESPILNSNPDHTEHEWGEWVETPATCTEVGKKTRSCSGCNKVQEEELEPLGHNFSRYFPDNNGDCVTVGTMTSKCYRCGEKKVATDPNSAKGHVFNKYIVAEKFFATAATCTESSTYYYSCVCGEIGEETFESGEYLPHKYDQMIAVSEYSATEVSCSKKATYYYSCACGAKGTKTFATGVTLPHTEAQEVAHEPTCVKVGSMRIYCTECKETVRYETIPATDVHEFVEKVEKEYYIATKDELTGEVTYYYSCSCGKKGTETFEPDEPTLQ